MKRFLGLGLWEYISPNDSGPHGVAGVSGRSCEVDMCSKLSITSSMADLNGLGVCPFGVGTREPEGVSRPSCPGGSGEADRCGGGIGEVDL